MGNGPDQAYPRTTVLWAEVCERGLLLSEWPPGTPPEPFRFPMRNRIIAALSEVLVVVESRERGGSLITAQAAIERSVDVMAVPGSVRNRAAAGTNQLLRDGAAPVIGVDDVLVALGLDTRRAGVMPYDPRPLPRGVEADVLAACRDDPRTLDDLVVLLGLSMTDAAMALARLERTGWAPRLRRVVRTGGVMVRRIMSEYPRPGAAATTPRRRGRRARGCLGIVGGPRGRPTCPKAWRIDAFARSLSSLSDHTVAAYASDVRGFADLGGASRRRRAARRYAARSCGATSPT